MLLLNQHHFINMCKWKETPTIKCQKLYRGLPLMSRLFPWYTPQKGNNVFTGSSLLEMYLYISFMLCMLTSANRPMWRPMWGYIPSSIWYLLYSFIVSTRLMFYERKLGFCLFMKLCLIYALAGSGLVKSLLQSLIDGNKHNECVKWEKKNILVL